MKGFIRGVNFFLAKLGTLLIKERRLNTPITQSFSIGTSIYYKGFFVKYTQAGILEHIDKI